MKKVDIGSKAYVFTSWGLVKSVVVEKRINTRTNEPQYKVVIDIDRTNRGRSYNFWYTKDRLNKYYFIASVCELFKPFGWWIKSILGR